MQIVFRKLYISILASVLILFTSIATTFAWVGMLTTSSLGSFDIELKVQDLKSDYFLKISSTGRSDDFSAKIPLYKIQNQIMDNMGIDCSGIIRSNENAVSTHFARNAKMAPVTTNNELSYFKEIKDIATKDTSLIDSNKYYKFDLYLTVDTNLPVTSSTIINANVFFENIETALSGYECGGHLVGENPFSNMSFMSPYSILPSLPRTGLKINSEYAARLAFKIYEPISIDSDYDDNSPVKDIIIYQKGTQYPTYNGVESATVGTTGIYCFGGILPEEYNLAIKEIEKLYKIKIDLVHSKDNARMLDADELAEYNRIKDKINNSESLTQAETEYYSTIDDSALYRNDKFMTKANYHIWKSPDTISGTNYLGIYNNVKTKLKISVYFWFEGWDADCLNFINKENVDLGISFATDTKNDL